LRRRKTDLDGTDLERSGPDSDGPGIGGIPSYAIAMAHHTPPPPGHLGAEVEQTHRGDGAFGHAMPGPLRRDCIVRAPDDRTRTAYHEAGHVVVAFTFPCNVVDVQAVTIAESGPYSGSLRIRNDSWLDGHRALTLAAVLVSGFEAEAMLIGRPAPEHARTDLAQAEDLYDLIADDGSPARVRAIRRLVHRRSRDLLERHWPAVGAVARALLRHTTICGTDARRIVERASVSRRRAKLRRG